MGGGNPEISQMKGVAEGNWQRTNGMGRGNWQRTNGMGRGNLGNRYQRQGPLN